MALTQKSLFLYGFQVTETNRSIDFRSVSLEPPRQATLNIGYYSLSSLCTEISRAMHAVDASRTFTVTVDRTVSGGQENRVTISTSGTLLELLGSSGPRSASSSLPLIGFHALDYIGSTSYNGYASAGTTMTPGGAGMQSELGYNFVDKEFDNKVYGSKNVSASGQKEAVVFGIQKFVTVEYMYQPQSKVVSDWIPLLTWAIQQRQFEYTPDITNPTNFYVVTLDKTAADGNGMAYKMTEMVSKQLPGFYQTGALTFRVKE